MATGTGNYGEFTPGAMARDPGETGPVLPGGRWWVHTDDQHHGVQALHRAYGVERLRMHQRAPFDLSVEVYQLEGMSLQHVRSPGLLAELALGNAGSVRVMQVLGGRLAIDYDHERIQGPGPWLLPGVGHTMWWADPELLSVSLGFAAVQAHAAALLGLEEFALYFTSGAPVSKPMAEHLGRLMTAIRRDQVPNTQAMSHPMVRAEVFNTLATAVLHTFPGAFLGDQAPVDRAAPGRGAIRRSVVFMEEHLGEPLTISQIAAATRVSPRALQLAYRKTFNTTPMAYLRSLRLEAVHAELLTADRTTTTVGEVAARWGFTHRGRFTAAYRHRYGRNPGTTLSG